MRKSSKQRVKSQRAVVGERQYGAVCWMDFRGQSEIWRK